MRAYRPLTEAEEAAIRAYAAKHGCRWKAALRDAWFRAAEPGLLQAIRNSHGPTWLAEFQLQGEL